MTAFIPNALAEIDALHRVLQAWFRAEGAQNPGKVLSHFDPGYTMVTATGKLISYEAFQAGLPAMWGTRPGLVMQISQQAVCHSGSGWAVLTYHERQHLNRSFTDRFSTVLMLDRGEAAGPVWRHLQETMIA